MRNGKRLSVLAAAALLVTGACAYADPPHGLYVGGGIGSANVTVEDVFDTQVDLEVRTADDDEVAFLFRIGFGVAQPRHGTCG